MHSDEKERELKFAADRMLGRLTRWLRLFGYDTYYSPEATPGQIIYIATKENRVLLTRRKKTCELLKTNCFLIKSSKLGKQIKELMDRFDISTDITYARCSLCNSIIKPIEKRFVKSEVPEYTYITHEQFYICSGCHKIYWKGTHQQRAEASLRRFLQDEDT